MPKFCHDPCRSPRVGNRAQAAGEPGRRQAGGPGSGRRRLAQALKQSGLRPPDEVSYGVWGYWGGYALKSPK